MTSTLIYAKRHGFSLIKSLPHRWQTTEAAVYQLRQGHHACLQDGGYLCGRIQPLTPYFYSSYEAENESIVTDKPKNRGARFWPNP